MKKENFDQLVRDHLADETIAPPAHIEAAVFDALTAEQTRSNWRKGGLIAFAALLTSASIWSVLNQEEAPIHPNAVQAVEPPVQEEAADAWDVAVSETRNESGSTSTEEAVNEAQAPSQERTKIEPANVHAAGERPADLSRAESRPVTALSSEHALGKPGLINPTDETWVLPATVEVEE